MRPLLLNLTTSLDGYIADRDEGIGWIQPPPDDAAAEYPADCLELMASVDALVMGRATYELSFLISGGTESSPASASAWSPRARTSSSAKVSSSFAGTRSPLSASSWSGTVWLFGGGRLATALGCAGLIDDYLFVSLAG